jgi:hypothetical protein
MKYTLKALFILNLIFWSGLAQTQVDPCSWPFGPKWQRVAKSELQVLGNKHFDAFTESMQVYNKRFIQAVERESYENLTFFRLDNRMMKQLNDVVLKNKGHSYSVSISFQSLFIEKVKGQYPALYKRMVLKYHDYKSLSLGFKSPVNKKLLAKIYRETQEDFGILLNRELKKSGVEIPYQYKDINKWHVASIGKTPDQAAMAAKLHPYEGALEIVDFAQKRSVARDIIHMKNESWQIVQRELPGDQFYKWHLVDGRQIKTLNLDVVHMGRKAQSLEEFTKQFRQVYPHSSYEGIKASYRYIQSIDQLTASVLTPSSVSLAPRYRPGMVVSVDIGQMGAQGFVETMKRVNNLTDLDNIIRESRKAFWRADSQLNSFYQHVNNSFGDAIDPTLLKQASHISGDDAVFVLDNSLAIKNQSQFFDDYLRKVSQHPAAHRFRVTNVITDQGLNLRSGNINTFIEKAESAEKYIRQKLMANPQIGLEKSKKIFIGIETTPLNQQQVRHRLVVINNSGLPDQQIRNYINQKYNDYIGSLNDSRVLFDTPSIQILR